MVRRRDLDQLVIDNAVKSGAVLRQGTEAVAPVYDGGFLAGAVVTRKGESPDLTEEVRARYVVVADGSLSRFGRSLGATRNRSYPQGLAIRGYYESPLHDDPWIESALDVRDRRGNSLPGYGWIFPVGDGTVNVGIGLLSTFRDWKSVNTTHLMEEWAATAPGLLGPHARRAGPASRRAVASRWRARSTRSPARPGWWSATPAARSTPSTARGSTTPTRPGAWRRASSTRPSGPATGSPWPATPGCSRRSTASTSRSPACSCA